MTGRPVAVITGGAGGVGLAVARRFGRDHQLLLSDAVDDGLAAAVELLAADGCEVIHQLCDVSNAGDVAALADAAAALGPLRVLAHVAGVSPSMTDARRILTVNLIGTCLVLDAFEPLVADGTVGVCVASISGQRRRLPDHDDLLADPGRDGFLEEVAQRVSLERPGSGYALSKRGVIVECERRAEAWGRRGGRLVSVSPGLIDTPMGRLEKAAGASRLERVAALRRAARDDEIAAAIAFLASPEASFITGTDLRVDGGAIAGLQHHAPPLDSARWDDPWHEDDPWKPS